VTSHITVTAVLAFLSVRHRADRRLLAHGFHFFSLFVPHGAPAG
jgi:F-type H+-transporting ATPase subunit a